jgi:hypothetical protein
MSSERIDRIMMRMRSELYDEPRGNGGRTPRQRHRRNDDDDGSVATSAPQSTNSDIRIAANGQVHGGAGAAAAAAPGARPFDQLLADASFRSRAGGGVPAYAADQAGEVFEPGPYAPVDWTKIDEADWANLAMRPFWNKCQLCKLGQTEDQRSAWEELDNIIRFPDRNFHEMDEIMMCEEMREMYDTYIKPGVDGEPLMRTRMFWIHTDIHAPTVRHMIESSLKNMTNQLRVLANEQTYERGSVSGALRVNAKAALLSLKIEKERKPVLKLAMEMRGTAPSKH